MEELEIVETPGGFNLVSSGNWVVTTKPNRETATAFAEGWAAALRGMLEDAELHRTSELEYPRR
jgi:hypothetical protein